MRLGKSLIGNPVFGIMDGRKLGQVKDLYLDDDLTSVVGLYLGREGLLRPTPLFIERGDVALFGIDVVLTEEAATVYEGDEAPEPPGWLRLAELEGRQVQTPGGTRIGKVGDVALDEDARVTGFSLTSLSVKGPVAEAEAVARNALVDVGAGDGVMTIDLAEAERAPLTINPDLLFSRPAPVQMPEEEEETFEEPGSFGQG
jgi:sporulation protein YlmC with PRC-barrel domain